ncbi:agrin-like [Centruroides vittatus]|uniref:agrin-like n=1 Tax=Centruroides sculpturatus TaxID=218467 RepID=UPI000C6E3343|nr:agrin-like [Centruroides sculpturatus]
MSLIYVFLALLVVTSEARRRYQDCHEDTIESREESADVVLTGTVNRVYTSSRGHYSCEVRIKRIIKGDRLEAGNNVLVEGLGNEDFCDSHLRSGDTRIFMLNRLSIGLYRLNSSLLQINVPNLDRVRNAVKDEIRPRRPPILDEPCEKKYCPHNGDCHFDKRIQLASCRCPDSCIYGGHIPVCGSDGITYPSWCSFRIDTCKQRKDVYMKHEGTCQISRSF